MPMSESVASVRVARAMDFAVGQKDGEQVVPRSLREELGGPFRVAFPGHASAEVGEVVSPPVPPRQFVCSGGLSSASKSNPGLGAMFGYCR